MDRLPQFDSLRAIAALTVFAFHIAFVLGWLGHDDVGPFLLQLNVGVAVFFLLSGFLLYRPFARARLERGSAPPTGGFAIRRAARIVPAYWVALPVTALWLGLDEVFTARGIVTYFGFLQIYDLDTIVGGIGQAWTLCVEVTFYAMLPLWALALRRVRFNGAHGFLRTELMALVPLFAIGVIWTVAVANKAAGDAALLTPETVWLPAFFDHFALGMALAVVSLALPQLDRGRIARAASAAGAHAGLAWGAAVVAFLAAGAADRWLGDAAAQVAHHELQAVAAFCLLLPAVFGEPGHGRVRQFLGNKVLLWLGLVSYAFYLWSPAIVEKLGNAGWSGGLRTTGTIGIGLVGSAAVAAASWYLLERHAIAVGRRLARRADGGERRLDAPDAQPVSELAP